MSDPLDEEIGWLVPMICRELGCGKIFCPGGFARPFTSRKVIASVHAVGWTWVEGKTATEGIPYCAEHAPEETP